MAPVCAVLGVAIVAAVFPGVQGGMVAVPAVALSLVYALAVYRAPTRADVADRLAEQDPSEDAAVSVLTDRPAGALASPMAKALWKARRSRARVALFRMPLPWPRLGLEQGMAASLRVGGIGVLVLVAGLLAPQITGPRLAAFLAPDGWSDDIQVSAWIAPPAYTGLPPRAVGPDPAALEVPRGSELTVSVRGAVAPPVLRTAPGRIVPMEALSSGSFERRFALDQGQEISVLAGGRAVLSRPVIIVPDRPPEALLTPIAASPGAPSSSRTGGSGTGADGILRLSAQVADDYGVSTARIVLAGDDGTRDIRDVPVSGVARETLTLRLDVGASALAGQKVTAVLEVADAIGQQAASAPLPLTLPERVFDDPLAHRVAQVRKGFLTRALAPSDAEIDLGIVLGDAELRTAGVTPYLALVSARERIEHGARPVFGGAVDGLLWKTAVALERARDADSPARQQFAEAMDDMMEALAGKMDPTQRQALTRALENSVQARLNDARASLRDGAQPGPGQTASAPVPRSLSGFMAELDAALAAGDMSKSLEMLAQLEEVMNALDRLTDPENRAFLEQAAATLEALDDMAARQEALMTDTHSAAQGRTGESTATGARLARDQSALESGAQGLAEELAKMVPSGAAGLDGAAQAMGTAARRLQTGALPSALTAQGAALEQLRLARAAATRDLAAGFAERGLPMMAQGMGSGAGNGAGGLDPLGRPMEGSQTGGDVGDGQGIHVPGSAGARRIQEIRDELRSRRSGPDLDPLMRAYIDRLLDRF